MPSAAVIRTAVLLLMAAVSASLQAQSGTPPPQDRQRPVFRAGTNLVRVDAYPSKDGKIIEGLKAEDFELLEDGLPQKIESFQFVHYEQNTPATERRDPNSQRDGFTLAADPAYRVFVIYLDNLHVDFRGSHAARAPLITFLNRVLGRNDLFGVLTTRHTINELMLGQKTEFIEEQLTKYWDWGRGSRVSEDEEDLYIDLCFPRGSGDLKARRRLDAVFGGLEGLMSSLAALREERKNILLVSDGWILPPRGVRPADAKPMMPRIGVTDAGKLTTGRTRAGGADPRVCEDLMQRLMDIDFRQRMTDLLRLARESNVTFYAIKPGGLGAPGMDESGRFTDGRADSLKVDSLRTLASNTDGIAVVNTNNLTAGAFRIGDDLSGSYILGYYPTNTKADGRVRRITVRLKGTKEAVRARREYRALSEAEVASMRAATASRAAVTPPAPAEEALSELKRLRPGAVLHTRGTIIGDELVLTTELTAPEVEAGRWKSGGDVQVMLSAASGSVNTTARGRIEPGGRAAVIRIPLQKAAGPFDVGVRLRNDRDGEARDGVSVARSASLFGDPLIFRLATPASPRPAGSVQFRRTERLRVHWPLSAALVERQGRLLGRDGVPLDLAVTLSDHEDAGHAFLVADLNLAPLTAGEYVIEIEGKAAGQEGAARLAIRVGR